MTNQFKITFSTYPLALTLMSTFVVIFVAFFFLGYFNPYFVAEYRAAAPITTVLGFIEGINPYQEEHIETYGNSYSVLWPGTVYLFAKLFGLASYDQIKFLMYVLNAVIVTSTAAVAFYVGLRNKLNALLALAISFTYLLLNTTKLSMGEFSYSAGLSCVFFALLLVNNKFNNFGLCMALALITLASLFKVYFALLAIVIAFNCAAFVAPRVLIVILSAWSSATACLFFTLSRVFPFYFDSVYLKAKMQQTWDPTRIVPNVWWFFDHFGFIFILIIPQLALFKRQEIQERRRQKLYAVGTLVVCVYVVFVMLPHRGNLGTYLLHLVAPIVLAYALSSREEIEPELDSRIGQIAVLAICILVSINITVWSSPWQRWSEFGVLWNNELSSNREALRQAANVIRSSAGRKIYVDFALAPLAIERHFEYVDNGSRASYADYVNARRNGTLKLSPLVSWLAARKPGGPERVHPDDMMERADVVICTFACPNNGSHQFVRNLGVLTTAFNGPLVVRLFVKAQGEIPRDLL